MNKVYEKIKESIVIPMNTGNENINISARTIIFEDKELIQSVKEVMDNVTKSNEELEQKKKELLQCRGDFRYLAKTLSKCKPFNTSLKFSTIRRNLKDGKIYYIPDIEEYNEYMRGFFSYLYHVKSLNFDDTEVVLTERRILRVIN